MVAQGTIFNIQKFSLHDGPGIRTTVFLKGCPLLCQWCSNPESQSFQPEISWNIKKCTHCLTCTKVATNHSITYSEPTIVIDQSQIENALPAIKKCPARALKLEGEKKEVSEVVSICKEDIDFYEESGGGVTLSGGEALAQPAFVKALVTALKQENLHVAVETEGFVPPITFQELAPLFDLLLFDVKHYDADIHKQYTAVTNETIIENLRWAIAEGIEVLPRIPVIPGFNSTIEDAKALAKLLVSVGAKKTQLLPFHQFGESKYEMLNRTYPMQDVAALHPEDLSEYQKEFIKLGIDCFI